MSNWGSNSYNAPSFPPPERASKRPIGGNPDWNHMPPSLPFSGQIPPFTSPAILRTQDTLHSSSSLRAYQPSADPDVHTLRSWVWPAGQGLTEKRSTESAPQTGHQLQSGNAPVTSQTNFPAFQGDARNDTASSREERMSMSRTNANTVHVADPQTTLHQPSLSPLLVRPPPGYHVPYSAPHDQRATQAFTESSNHPNLALRKLLDCVLHSTFIHDQDCEPLMADYYSKYVLRQVIGLNGFPPIDINNPKESLLTIFVEKSGHRPCCLICGKSASSVPRTLGCVRSHLQYKPFRCDGCQMCNAKNGYATFWTDALLRDHVEGQTLATCTECGVKLRQGNMRRHRATIHKRSALGGSRYLNHTSTPIHIANSQEEEDVEDLINFLLEEEEEEEDVDELINFLLEEEEEDSDWETNAVAWRAFSMTSDRY